MRQRLTTFAAGLATALAVACGDRGEAPAPAPAADEPASSDVAPTYAPELNVDLTRATRTESGLYVEDLREGDGETAEVGRTVLVHYTGWLPDGTQFDSSHDRGEPIDLMLGRRDVIDGWEQGIQGMRVGGERLLVIPPSLAYGNQGRGPIPPGATLVFRIQLVEVR